MLNIMAHSLRRVTTCVVCMHEYFLQYLSYRIVEKGLEPPPSIDPLQPCTLTLCGISATIIWSLYHNECINHETLHRLVISTTI